MGARARVHPWATVMNQKVANPFINPCPLNWNGFCVGCDPLHVEQAAGVIYITEET